MLVLVACRDHPPVAGRLLQPFLVSGLVLVVHGAGEGKVGGG